MLKGQFPLEKSDYITYRLNWIIGMHINVSSDDISNLIHHSS